MLRAALPSLSITAFDAVSQALGLDTISAPEMLTRFTADSPLISRDSFVTTLEGGLGPRGCSDKWLRC